jgi:hypothetical protein
MLLSLKYESEVKEVRQCLTNVKYAAKDKFPETMFPTPTDTPEENGMQTSRRCVFWMQEQSEKQKYALVA